MLYHNGTPLIAPSRGMTQTRFDAVMTRLTDDDLAGAQTTSGKVIDATFLRSSAKLQSRSDGTYLVQVNRDADHPQFAVTKSGAPFVLDLRNRNSDPVSASSSALSPNLLAVLP